jgi:hypothetical protein
MLALAKAILSEVFTSLRAATDETEIAEEIEGARSISSF